MGARATHIRWPGDDLSRSLIRHLGNSVLLATFTEWATDRRPPIAPGLDNTAYTAGNKSHVRSIVPQGNFENILISLEVRDGHWDYKVRGGLVFAEN